MRSRQVTTSFLLSMGIFSVEAFAPVGRRGAFSSTSITTIGGRSTRSSSSSSSSLLKSTVEEEAVSSATTKITSSSNNNNGPQVAQGTVVAKFAGGFRAVQLEETFVGTVDPQVLDLTGSKGSTSSTNEDASLAGDLQGRQVVFANGASGVVVAHRPPLAFVLGSEQQQQQDEDGPVKIYQDMASVTVPDEATVVDWFGRTPEGSVAKGSQTRPIFSPIPQVKDIALINHPVLTGITMFDTLAPLGRGQNMLFVSSDRESLRGYATDLIRTQLQGQHQSRIVYAVTDEQESLLDRFDDLGLTDQITVVAPSAGSDKSPVAQAAEAVALAGTACAIGESWALEEGANSLVIIDTIAHHRTLWDATTRVLVDVFGVDAVVEGDRNGGASSEMRAFYSSLIQRAAQYKQNRGGGSLTLLILTPIPGLSTDEDDTVYQESDFEGSPAKVMERIKLLVNRKIPLTAANLSKIDIPIPSTAEGERRFALQHVDDLISMSDGQIWMDDKLRALQQQQPPLDPQRSITRVGIGADTDSRADAPALRKVVEGLRLALSQAANMEGAEATKASVKQTQRQQALLRAMHQPPGAGGRRLSESCVVLFAAARGHLDQVDETKSSDDASMVHDLLAHARTHAAEELQSVDETLDMDADTRDALGAVIDSFFEARS